MSLNLSKYFIALLLLFSVSLYSETAEAQVDDVCPVDLVELELQVEQTIPLLGETIELIDGLLVLLEPIQALDALGLLDPLADLLLEIVGDTTALLETLELFAGASADDQCDIALDICAQSLGLFDLIGLVPGTVDDTLAAVLPLPIIGDLLSDILNTLFGVTDFLLGTLSPALGDLAEISCSQSETPPVQECDFIAGSPVCADPDCAPEEIVPGLTCEDFNQNPEDFCDDQVGCDDPNCAGTEACTEEPEEPGEPEPEECNFIDGSPDCSDETCALEEIAEGLTCEEFNLSREGYCDDQVSCDNFNCEDTAVCDAENPPNGGTGLSGGGCNMAAPAATTAAAVANFMLLLLLPLAGGYILRRARSK